MKKEISFCSLQFLYLNSKNRKREKNAKFEGLSPETVFLVMLGTSSFSVGHEIYGKTTAKFVPN